MIIINYILGGKASYVNGDLIVSRSCVPIATSVLRLSRKHGSCEVQKKKCMQASNQTISIQRQLFNIKITIITVNQTYRQMFWCNLSCNSIKLLYDASSKVISRKTAHTTNGRIWAVSRRTFMVISWPLRGGNTLN